MLLKNFIWTGPQRIFKRNMIFIFIVCSEDLAWAKSALEEHKSNVTISEGRNARNHMAILTISESITKTVDSIFQQCGSCQL